MDEESVDTFMTITGASQLVAVQKLTEHGGVLNEAVNSYFTQPDTNISPDKDNLMDIDETHRGFHHPETASRIDNGTDDDDDDDVVDGISHDTRASPGAPPDYGIEEEIMIQAAIKASKREPETGPPDVPTEQEKAFGDQLKSETRASKSAEVEHRLGVGSSFVQDEPRVRRRTRSMNLSSPLGPAQQHNVNNLDEWGGISSEEHDEAVMLEAAMFGGAGYHVPYARTRHMSRMRRRSYYTRSAPRSPSPTLTAQRLIREQQNDEYLASLQADREKELLEQAAREAALEEEERKLEQEQEIERQVAAKETSLPPEPASDEDNAVTLLVRMPDGSRRGRRFMKTDKLRYLLDFIDVGRVVKPSTYRLVRPYPRRAFGDGESDLTLNQLGLTSKQEALFLELI